MRLILLSLLLLGLGTFPAAASTGTWSVIDANGVTRQFDVVIDGSGNYASMYVICDYVAAAQCAAVDPANDALKVECVEGC